MIFYSRRKQLTLAALAIFFLEAHAEKVKIPIGTYHETYHSISELLIKEEGCPDITKYTPESKFLISAEFVVLCNALRLGGVEPDFTLTPYPISARMQIELEKGRLMLTSFPIWSRYLKDERLLASNPVVERGMYAKYIYTRFDHIKTLSNALPKLKRTSLSPAKKIRNKYSVISNPNWHPDIEALGCLDIDIVTGKNYEDMFKVVNARGADFLLIHLATTTNHIFEIYDISLHLVPGYKVVFDDSLHFLISKAFKDSHKVQKALNHGIKVLEENGELKRIYKALGYYPEHTLNWVNLGCTH